MSAERFIVGTVCLFIGACIGAVVMGVCVTGSVSTPKRKNSVWIRKLRNHTITEKTFDPSAR